MNVRAEYKQNMNNNIYPDGVQTSLSDSFYLNWLTQYYPPGQTPLINYPDITFNDKLPYQVTI